LEFDYLAKRYGVLPSTILHGDIVDLQFNLLVAMVGTEEEVKAAQKAQRARGRHGK
jgi:hypothetical protein